MDFNGLDDLDFDDVWTAEALLSPRIDLGNKDSKEFRRRALSLALSSSLDGENNNKRLPSMEDTCWIADREDLPHRATADEMDEERRKNVAYQYLCHLEEAKKWIEACINEELPPTTELEEGLRNGVYLGKLAHFFAPDKVPLKRIFDKDQAKYQTRGLMFRHTDNIMHWFNAMEITGLPKIFYPETTDVYDRKNMPRTVYCLHALSLFLFKLGIAPQIQDLYGKVEFTEEEISAMQQELDKYGIQMPAFSKIGGILANELSVDDAAVHAAVIAINDAIDKQVVEETYNALGNPNALMKNLSDKNKEPYQNALFSAKDCKRVTTLNKSVREGEEQDVYDTLLTQAEIQGNINKVNIEVQLTMLNSLMDSQDASQLLATLNNLGLKDVKPENVEYYLSTLLQAREEKMETTGSARLEKEDVQAAVNAANILAKEERELIKSMVDINSAIDSSSPQDLVNLLTRPEAQLPDVFSYTAELYQSELKRLKESNEEDLNHEQLVAAVQLLSAVSRINAAVDAGEPNETILQLQQSKAGVGDVDDDTALSQRYQDKLASFKRRKAREGQDFVTHEDIQEAIDQVNDEVKEEHERVMAVAQINEAIDSASASETLSALQMDAAKLRDVNEAEAVLYQRMLFAAKTKKAETSEDEVAVLWLDEIQEAVDSSNVKAADTLKLANGMAVINRLVDAGTEEELLGALKSSDVGLVSVLAACSENYQKELREEKVNKLQAATTEDDVQDSGWVCHKTKDDDSLYFNTNTREHLWLEPDGFEASITQLSKEDTQTVVSRTTATHDRAQLFQENEHNIIKIQAHYKGYQVRKAYNEKKNFFNTQLPAIIRIQCWYKGYKQRKAFRQRKEFLASQLERILLIQSFARMWIARTRYRNRKKYFAENVNAVVKLQAFWRSVKARNDYFVLTHSENPPVSVVRKYVHLLEENEADLTAELELQELRGKVVKQIRSNQQLEQDLNVMDIKIGLLIKNRITLQDVVSHGKKLHTAKEVGQSGLKTLSKEKREMLEGYQHLLYLLQTNPTYLAKLIFAMPQSKTTKFMESVILALYNYAANQREEFLLLKLFKTALEEEIASKVDKMMEIVTGNPMVIRMVVTFNRGQKGQSSLRDILQPLVKMVMDDKNLNINLSPVDVYKGWINKMETETGEACKLPYDVSTEQALTHKEVVEVIGESAKTLENVAEKFLNAIINAVDMIPFGIRYIAKVLKKSLHEKFPDEPEEDILKIVGNLIYYRYMNPAIVAPDAFDIIDIGVDKGMSTEQRKNLGSVTKVLQTVASGKEFSGENEHLSSLNAFVRKSFPKFKEFCVRVCDVPEPEERFNIDEYSDFVNPTKPIVLMSVAEILDTHALLVEHAENIAPESSDSLHELLKDLGDVPGIEDMLGEVDANENQADNSQLVKELGKTEISLTLQNKFEIQEDNDQDTKRLFIKTKRLLVDVIRVQGGESIPHILKTPFTQVQEKMYDDLLDLRLKREEKQDSSKLTRNISALDDSKLGLEAKKNKIDVNLVKLCEAEVVTLEDNYQNLANAIAQDIRNQRRYRQRRKQDMLKMKKTLGGLDSKADYYKQSSDYYNQYINTCLQNLAAKRHSRAKPTKGSKEGVKYNAAKLKEKGVILNIDGLGNSEFKNVMFEIAPSEKAGVFTVSAKFLGVKMDSVDLVFQDLLQLQYEGAAVMDMFGRAKINVNLLIFLLNKKFYGK